MKTKSGDQIMSPAKTTMATLPCCPDMVPDDICDTLDFHYRLNYPVTLREADNRRIPVEVKLHFRLTRCPGPLALGNLLYTTTLLPGEKVKLFTSDRRTRFTYDSTSKVSYRNTQTSEESFYMQQMSDALMDTSARATRPSRAARSSACRRPRRCRRRHHRSRRIGQYER